MSTTVGRRGRLFAPQPAEQRGGDPVDPGAPSREAGYLAGEQVDGGAWTAPRSEFFKGRQVPGFEAEKLLVHQCPSFARRASRTWCSKYPIISVEDGHGPSRTGDGWEISSRRKLGKDVQLVGRRPCFRHQPPASCARESSAANRHPRFLVKDQTRSARSPRRSQRSRMGSQCHAPPTTPRSSSPPLGRETGGIRPIGRHRRWAPTRIAESRRDRSRAPPIAPPSTNPAPAHRGGSWARGRVLRQGAGRLSTRIK